MLTIFTVPKPFDGHVALIQRNAIASWRRLGPECQVIICGDEPGSRAVAREFQADHIADVERNDFGTPLLSSVFQLAEERATADILCYANADLIFLPDFLEAVARVSRHLQNFLIVGETWDLDVTDDYIGGHDGWDDDLRCRAAASGTARTANSIDFFVFRSGALGPLPPFAVGRPAWDNWMIFRARSHRVPVVDVSAFTTVIHQHHDYGHVKQARGDKWEGPEADRNLALLGIDRRRGFSIDDATHKLTPDGLVRNPAKVVRRCLKTQLLATPALTPAYRVARAIYLRFRRPR